MNELLVFDIFEILASFIAAKWWYGGNVDIFSPRVERNLFLHNVCLNSIIYLRLIPKFAFRFAS